MGRMTKAIENELFAIDDRTFRWVLKKPYPKMLLGARKGGHAVLLCDAGADSDPFQQISEYVGSGPMCFVRNEWVPGAKAVFEKFADYVPRQEPASWLAGGKNIVVDRIDPATASAALQNGEVDWLELVVPDLLPVLRKNRNVVTAINDPVVMDHLFPPLPQHHPLRCVEDIIEGQPAWRRNVSGIVQAPLPLFWGVSKRRNLRWIRTSNLPRGLLRRIQQ
jgi:peptide/nickel transport system substrate-binding protein